jgi:hypothetical protein
MAKSNRTTFEKRRRELEKKQKRAAKLEKKHDRSEPTEEKVIPDPLDAFKEYESQADARRAEERREEEKRMRAAK